MKVIYEAKDGTQFNTETECREYEHRHCALFDLHNFVAADSKGNPVPADGYGYSPDDFDYFCCFTEKAVEDCKELFHENGIRFNFAIEPNKVYHYNYDEDIWQPLSERLGYLRSECNRLSVLEEKILSAKQS